MIKFSELGRKKIFKTYEGGIEVYNPSPEQQNEIIRFFENKELKISGRDLLLKFIPMLSNIEIDLEDENTVNEIINDPCEELKKVSEDITEIISNLVNRVIKTANQISKLPKKAQEEVIRKLNEGGSIEN